MSGSNHDAKLNEYLAKNKDHPDIAHYRAAMQAVNSGELTSAKKALETWRARSGERHLAGMYNGAGEAPDMNALRDSVYRTYRAKGGEYIPSFESVAMEAARFKAYANGTEVSDEAQKIEAAKKNIDKKLDDRLK